VTTIICAAEVAPGVACGLPENAAYDATGGALLDVHPDLHPFIPGQTCRDCNGSGLDQWQSGAVVNVYPCPRCIAGVERIND
jgi:hypothetical protein